MNVTGTITLFTLDCHQKTSEYLDLLKYVSFMPFADISKLNKLIEDKFDLIKKTKLDIWLLYRMRDFINELSRLDKIKAVKPKVHLFNGNVTRESLGIDMSLPSFTNVDIRHDTVQSYIEEVSMMYIIRPKQLYGSQFMDRSITLTAEWNLEYERECEQYGKWVTEGYDQTKPFPFNSKFAFNNSAIIHSTKHFQHHIPVNPRKVIGTLSRTVYNGFMHDNCSSRGATKHKKDRSKANDLHTTSMEACLKHYEEKDYKDSKCTVLSIASSFIESGEPMQFSMSEKEQRGSGRPIATPTLGTKAALMLIEKPEQAIGKHVPNNIVVPGKHKLKEQAETFKRLVSAGAIANFKYIYQLTEDQSKFSENDNVKKYYPYIAHNTLLPHHVRLIQTEMLKKLEKREHLVKKIPDRINSTPALAKYRNSDLTGIVVLVGWPQGMLNDTSTSVHSQGDYWITDMINKTYPEKAVMTEGLVHSDDSWVAVACNSQDDFELFVIFRMLAKRFLCLKLNDKKV